MILLLTIPFLSSFTLGEPEQGENYTERIDFYFAASSALWKVTATGGNLSINGLDLSSAPFSGIEGIQISFQSQRTWFKNFNLLLQGALYETGLTRFIPNTAVLVLDYEDGLSPLEVESSASAAASEISDVFRLALGDARSSSGNAFEFVSPIDPETHFPLVWESLPLSSGGFINATAPEMLAQKLASFITLRTVSQGLQKETTLVFGALESSVLDEQSGQFSLFSVLPSLENSTTSEFSDGSVLEFHFRDAYIDSVSHEFDVEYEMDGGLATLRMDLSSNATVPSIFVGYGYSMPALSATRDFSVKTVAGLDTVEVTLEVSNIGVPSASNVTIEEPKWWDDSEFELVDGNLSQQFATILPGSSKEMKYTLQTVYEGEPKPKAVPRARVTFISPELGENITYLAWSNTQLLWLGTDAAPYIDLRLKEITTLNPDITDEISFKLIATNNGTVAADEVVIGGTHHGSLEPGSSIEETVTVTVDNDRTIRKELSGQVEFEFEGKKYTIEGPRLDVLFRPTSSYTPTVKIDRILQPSSQNGELILTVETKITNTGESVVDSVVLRSRLPEDTIFLNGSQKVSYDSTEHEVAASFTQLGRNEEISVDWNLRVPEGGVLIPDGSVVLKRLSEDSVFHTQVAAFVDGISVVSEALDDETVLGVDVPVSILLLNEGRFSLYDFELQIPQANIGSVAPANESLPQSGPELEPRSSQQFELTYVPSREGVSTLSGGSIRGIAGGNTLEVPVESFSILVFRGLGISVTSPDSVSEDQEFSVSLEIVSDIPDRVKDVQVAVAIQSGLGIVSLPEGVNSTLSSFPAGGVVELEIRLLANEPGSYAVTVKEVQYVFDGSALEYFQLSGEEKKVAMVTVQENLTERYGFSVAIALALAIATAAFLRLRPAGSA